MNRLLSKRLLHLYCSAGAARKEYHSLGALNNRNLFSNSSGGSKSKTKVLAGLVSPEAPLWLAHGHLLALSSHGLFLGARAPWCFFLL